MFRLTPLVDLITLMTFSAVLPVHYCLENDSGSNALSREAGPWSPAPAQHPGGWSEAVRRLGGEI